MRSFADTKERITVIPRLGGPGPQKPYTTSITNVLVEGNYYTLTDGDGAESFVVEEAYSQLESLASEALRVMLEDGLVLDNDQRTAWSEFMAAQVTRGRQFRAMVDRFTQEIADKLTRVVPSPPPDLAVADQVAQAGGPRLRVTPEVRRSLIDDNATQERRIALSFIAHDQLTSGFARMSWKLIRFPQPWLFSSDHPVAYWREPDPERDRLGLGIGPAIAHETRIALSPTAMLILTHPHQVDEPGDTEHIGTYETARRLNWDHIEWPASQQWLLCPDVKQHPLPVVPWPDEWKRPWLRTGRYRPEGGLSMLSGLSTFDTAQP